jgi:hypothetical protein
VRFTLSFILFALLLIGCRSEDTKLSQQILGTWTRAAGDWSVVYDGSLPHWKLKPPGSMTILSDGTFSSSWGSSNSFDSYRGTWQIKDGMLILTDTNRNGTAKLVLSGRVGGNKIVRVDDHQLVYETTSGEKIILGR